jgi:uncharacterized membrane protein
MKAMIPPRDAPAAGDRSCSARTSRNLALNAKEAAHSIVIPPFVAKLLWNDVRGQIPILDTPADGRARRFKSLDRELVWMDERRFGLTIVALILLIPITVITIVIIAVATGGFGGGYYYWGPMGGMMGEGWIFMLIPLTFLVVLFVMLMLAAARPSSWRPFLLGPWDRSAPHDRQDAEAILDERYASGDISREEFMRIKEDLKANRR